LSSRYTVEPSLQLDGWRQAIFAIDQLDFKIRAEGQPFRRFDELQLVSPWPGLDIPRNGQPAKGQGNAGPVREGNAHRHRAGGRRTNRDPPRAASIQAIGHLPAVQVRRCRRDDGATQVRRTGQRLLLRLIQESHRAGQPIAPLRKPLLDPLGDFEFRQPVKV